MTSDLVAKVVFFGLILSWFGFAGIFFFRKKPPDAHVSRRSHAALFGILLQGIANWIVWVRMRSWLYPELSIPISLQILLGLITLSLAAGSIWLVYSSVQALGKQWAVSARLVEEHKLITTGPYRWVRNPIYLGMFGMLVATGLVAGPSWNLPIAILLFAAGTVIRVRTEEKLLRQAFGAEFDDYTKRVPAVIPGIW